MSVESGGVSGGRRRRRSAERGEDQHCGPTSSSDSFETQEHLNSSFSSLNLTESNSEASATGVGDVRAAGQSDVTDSSGSLDERRHVWESTQESGRFEEADDPPSYLTTDDINSVASATMSEEERRCHRERVRNAARNVTVPDRAIHSVISHLKTRDILRYTGDSDSSTSATSCGEVKKCKLRTMPHCTAQVGVGCEGYCGEHYATLVRSAFLKPPPTLMRKVRKALAKKEALRLGLDATVERVATRGKSEVVRRKDSGRKVQTHSGRRDRSASARIASERKRKSPTRSKKPSRWSDVIESSEEGNVVAKARSTSAARRCVAPHCGARLSRDEEGLCRRCVGALEQNRQQKKVDARELKREVRRARESTHKSPVRVSTRQRPPVNYVRPHAGARHTRSRHIRTDDVADSSDEFSLPEGGPSSLMSDSWTQKYRPSDSGFETPEQDACCTPGCSEEVYEGGLCHACHRYRLRHH